MRSQHEKNKEILMDEIEMLCDRPMNDAIAVKLSNYRGALKALCWAEKEWEEETGPVEGRAAEPPAHTPELDGDTELEHVFMQIPSDKSHMMALFNILSDHMDQLSVVHHKMYENLMMRFREVAQN